jgi:hypothetical protein
MAHDCAWRQIDIEGNRRGWHVSITKTRAAGRSLALVFGIGEAPGLRFAIVAAPALPASIPGGSAFRSGAPPATLRAVRCAHSGCIVTRLTDDEKRAPVECLNWL